MCYEKYSTGGVEKATINTKLAKDLRNFFMEKKFARVKQPKESRKSCVILQKSGERRIYLHGD
jgi:hypothetical protein